jgi:hypothetical protein
MRKSELFLRHWGGEGRGNGAGFFSLGRNLVLGLSYLHVFKNMLKNSVHYKYQKMTHIKHSSIQESRILFKNSDWNIENGPEYCIEVIQTWRSCKSLSIMERGVTCSSIFFSCYLRSNSFMIFLGCICHVFTKQHLKIPKPITDTSLTLWLMSCQSVQSLWMIRVNVESHYSKS